MLQIIVSPDWSAASGLNQIRNKPARLTALATVGDDGVVVINGGDLFTVTDVTLSSITYLGTIVINPTTAVDFAAPTLWTDTPLGAAKANIDNATGNASFAGILTIGTGAVVTPTRLSLGYNQSVPTADQCFVFGHSNVCTTSAINAFIFGLANTLSGSAVASIHGNGNSVTGTGTTCNFVGGDGNAQSGGGTSYCVIGSSNVITGSPTGTIGNTCTVSGSRSLAMGCLANVTRAGVINWAMPDTDPIFNMQKWTDTNTMRDLFDIVTTWATATDASRKGRASIGAYDTAFREAVRVEASGSAPMVGFLGANAAVRQATPVTLADVIALLQTFGLCS